MDDEPDATPETEGKNPNKYLIMVPYVETQGEKVGQVLPGVWREYRDGEPGPVLFIDAPEAYRYATKNQIEDGWVLKRHGHHTGQASFKAQHELF